MMSVLGIELLSAKAVNAAYYLGGVIAIGKQSGFKLIYHISAMSPCGVPTIPDGDGFDIF
ncbi:hypothetical protein D3C73_1095790 [compost metagenome]